ncbi:MAG TPA: translocation/assembly module TamB domain-containing protein [Spirochaetales bacterium]|nr:translocation/assembly module TamB domain-containing protein [Spirochaetales bacterium]
MKLRAPAPIVIAAIVVLAVSAAWAVVAPPLLGRMESAAAALIEREAAYAIRGLGLSASYRAASRRLLGSIELRGVELRGGESVVARVRRLQLRYGLGALLGGRFELTGVRVDGVSMAAELQDAKALVERLASALPGTGSSASEGAASLAVELRRLTLTLELGDGATATLSLRAADLLLDGPGGVRASAAGSIRASDPSGRYLATAVELPFSCTASVRSPGGQGSGLEASIAAVIAGDSDLGRLSRARIDATLDDTGLSASVEPGAGIERLRFDWNPSTGLAKLDLAVTRWSPASLFYPAGRLSGARPWLESSYSGSLRVSSDLSAEGTSVAADLRGVIPLALPGGRPRATLSASGGWDTLRVRSATLRNGSLGAEFSGELSLGRLSADGRLSASYALGPGLEASADFQLSGAGRSWFAYAPAIRAADATLGDATVSLELSSSSGAPNQASFYLDASLPTIADADGDPAVEPVDSPGIVEASSARAASRLTIEGSASLGEEPYLEAVARVGTLSLEAFPGLLTALVGAGAADALAPLSVGGELSLYSDLSGLSYNSSGLLVVYDGAIKGFGMLGFSGGLDRLRISSIDATIGGYSVKGSASLEYGASSGPSFAADLRVEDVPYGLSGAMADGAVFVSGDYGLRFVGSGRDDEYVASLDIDQMPIPLFGSVSFLSAAADGRFSSTDDWNLVFESLALEQPYGSASRLPSVSLAGAFDESGGRVGSLGYRDAVSSLNGSATVTWTLSGGFRVSGNARMAGPAGEYYALDGEYASDGTMDAALSTRKAPLARLYLPWLRGVVDADARIGGSIRDPSARFSFTVNGGQRADNLPFAAGAGTFERGVLSLVDSRVRLGDQAVSGLTLSYGVGDAAASLAANVELAMGRNRLTGRLVAVGASNGAGPSPFGDYLVAGELSGASWTGGELGDIPFSLGLADGDASLSMGPSGELEASLGAAGELRASLDRSMPISLEAQGVLADGVINVDVRDAVVDLPFLFKLIGLPMLGADSGVGRGAVTIRGKAVDPSVEGSFELEGFYLSLPDYVSEPIGPLEAPLFFTGRTMETLQTDVPCGDAVLTVALEGVLNQGIPDDVHLTVSTSGLGLVPVSTKLLGLDIDGLARPELVIDANRDRSRMTGSIMLASGDVVITPGVVSGRMQASRGAGILEPVEFTGALDISFGKAVRVYFPDKRLPVIYGLTDPSSRLSVDFDAALGEFNLDGQAVLRGGSVFYIQRNFYLKHATIDFDEDAEQFDPLINAEAETRTSSESGPVVVTLRAVDSRLSSLSFSLESSPSMAEDTILQMLGQNLIGAQGGSADLGRFVFENSDLIPQLNVMSVLERNLHGLLGLDLFVVRSQVFQRWLYDVSGLSGSSGASSLADYLDETAIVGGKYIGDKLFAQLALSLVADPLASSAALSLDSEFSLEWKAPHFTLNWSIEPEHPDSLFIEDQSFSFLWRIPLQ